MGALLRGQDDISAQVPMPIDRTDDSSVSNDVAAEVVTWFYLSSGAWVSATGEAAGTIVQGKVTYSGILNSAKTAIGHTKDTSVVLAAATRFDTRVDVPDDVFARMQFMSPTDQVTAITPYLTTNGHYAIDHRRSQLWGKALAVVADDTMAYSYTTPITGGGTGDKVDLIKWGGTSLTAADAAADAEANTEIGGMSKSRLFGFNGTTWDRLRAGITTVTATLTGWLNTLPWAIYNASPTTRTEGQGGPLQADADGDLKTRDKAYDSLTQANKSGEVNPLNEQYVPAKLIDETNITTNTTTYAYFDMSGYKYFGIQGETSGAAPTDVLTVTVEATMQDDGTAQASCAYQDVTNELFGVASWVDTDFIENADEVNPYKYVRVKYVTSNGAGSDADLTVYLKKLY
jgi:hypothetical protein